MAGMLTPPVLRHLPPPLQQTDDIGAWIDLRHAEASIFLVQTNDARLIGLLILADMGGTPASIHVGYLFGEAHWGRGYATELLRGLVASVTPPVRLVAGVAPENRASVRVLERAGFIQSTTDPAMYVHRLEKAASPDP